MQPVLPDYVPVSYPRIKVVDSLSRFFNESFGPQNVILRPRALIGDFRALARWIDEVYGIEKNQVQRVFTKNDLDRIHDEMPSAEQFALRQIIGDMEDIHGRQLNKDNLNSRAILMAISSSGYVETDYYVSTLHHDEHYPGCSLGRSLCCYTGPVTEWVKNEDAQVRVPGSFLYDLKPGAAVHTFRLGDMWRSAGYNIAGAGAGTAPFLHRSRRQKPGDVPRLVLQAE